MSVFIICFSKTHFSVFITGKERNIFQERNRDYVSEMVVLPWANTQYE